MRIPRWRITAKRAVIRLSEILIKDAHSSRIIMERIHGHYTIREAAEVLGLKPMSLRVYMRRGLLNFTIVNGHYYVTAKELNRYGQERSDMRGRMPRQRRRKYTPEFVPIDYSLATSETPLDIMLQRERSERIALAIETLPETEKIAVVGHDLDGAPLAEIGCLLDVERQWVSKLRQRALEKLRHHLHNDEYFSNVSSHY